MNPEQLLVLAVKDCIGLCVKDIVPGDEDGDESDENSTLMLCSVCNHLYSHNAIAINSFNCHLNLLSQVLSLFPLFLVR